MGFNSAFKGLITRRRGRRLISSIHERKGKFDTMTGLTKRLTNGDGTGNSVKSCKLLLLMTIKQVTK